MGTEEGSPRKKGLQLTRRSISCTIFSSFLNYLMTDTAHCKLERQNRASVLHQAAPEHNYILLLLLLAPFFFPFCQGWRYSSAMFPHFFPHDCISSAFLYFGLIPSQNKSSQKQQNSSSILREKDLCSASLLLCNKLRQKSGLRQPFILLLVWWVRNSKSAQLDS